MGRAQVKGLGWNLAQFLLLLQGAFLPRLEQERCRGNFYKNLMAGKIQPFRPLEADKGPVPARSHSSPLPEFRMLQ